MSTLEVTCGRCSKRFRVRAEFAGRSTRCPGCSAPITITGPARPAPSPARPVEEERPRPRRRPGDDEYDAPRRTPLNWGAVDSALRREQIAVVCSWLSVLGGLLVTCAGNLMRAPGMMDGPLIVVFMLIGLGPSLATAAFGVMARLSALGAPRESLTRGSAVASLLCALAGLVCLVGLFLGILMSFDNQRPDELLVAVPLGGLVVAGLGAVGTFFAFVAQVGIIRHSGAVSRGIARTAVATAVCTLALIAIALLYTLVNGLTAPGSYGPYGYYPDHGPFYGITLGVLVPIAGGVVLILYHRLLAAGRRAVQADTARDADD